MSNGGRIAKSTQRYDSRLSTLVFVYYHICLSARIRENTIGKDLAQAAKTLLSLVHRTVSGVPGWHLVNWLLSGLDGGVRL
jgi:hypothetical protein